MEKNKWSESIIVKELEFFYNTQQWDKYDIVFERLRLMGAFV